MNNKYAVGDEVYIINLQDFISVRQVTIEDIILIQHDPGTAQIFYGYDRISPFINERDVFKTFDEAHAEFKLRVGEAH